jgi:hypothetical protein
MAVLDFQSFVVEDTAVTAMLETIQDMKFFLGMAFGDSKEFAISTIEVKTRIGSRKWRFSGRMVHYQYHDPLGTWS